MFGRQQTRSSPRILATNITCCSSGLQLDTEYKYPVSVERHKFCIKHTACSSWRCWSQQHLGSRTITFLIAISSCQQPQLCPKSHIVPWFRFLRTMTIALSALSGWAQWSNTTPATNTSFYLFEHGSLFFVGQQQCCFV